MRNALKITAFIFIAIGTTGLLLNEFVWEHSTTCTIIFAILNLIGLISLAIIRFSRGKEIT
jgi:Na+/alanine symporter